MEGIHFSSQPKVDFPMSFGSHLSFILFINFFLLNNKLFILLLTQDKLKINKQQKIYLIIYLTRMINQSK